MINFYGVGERVVDTLLLYALSDLARIADPKSNFSWSPGKEIIFSLNSSEPRIKDKMLNILKKNARSICIANCLDFKLNVAKEWKVSPSTCLYCAGNRKENKLVCKKDGYCGRTIIPAYAVFYKNLEELESINWPNAYCISKSKSEGYETLYMGLSPFWSKGVRQWDSEWGESSSYVPRAIQVLLFYALSKYAIVFQEKKFFIELFFSPSFETYNYKDAILILSLVRRLVTRFGMSIRDIHLSELPIDVIPFVILSEVDLPSIIALSLGKLNLMFVSYDIEHGAPKNARGYEERSLVDIANFYLNLGDLFWDFKLMIEDLVNQMWLDEFKARILEILIDLSYAISGRNLWRLNDALFKAKGLAKDLWNQKGKRIHLLSPDSALYVQHIIEVM